MGFTHYWRRKKIIEFKKMERIVSDFKMAYREIRSHCDLAGVGGVGKPMIDEISIAFNGRRRCDHSKKSSCRGDCSHDCVIFSRIAKRVLWHDPNKKEYFDFCKTNRKPYDLAVKLLLIITKHYLKSAVTISSNGADIEWLKAKELCQQIFGYGMDFKLDRNRSLIAELKNLAIFS
jgi:hypothetical protein